MLSPMSAISDSPFRLLCRRMGSAFSFTEFVNADGIVRGNRKYLKLFAFEPEERPVIFQIFGSDPDVIIEAARIAEELGPDVIDLNMGCSAHRVSRRGAGAGLLLDPPRSGRIIEGLCKSLTVPVTAKIRLGWDDKSRNYLEVARILEESGASMISVHGRTKAQAYGGRADWNAIGEVKARVKVPVLGNGDVRSYEEARSRMRETGVDGVLIGRAAIGNPWIFSNRARDTVGLDELFETALAHLHAMCVLYERGAIMFRKHAARYFRNVPGAAQLRVQLMKCESADEYEEVCKLFREQAGWFPHPEP